MLRNLRSPSDKAGTQKARSVEAPISRVVDALRGTARRIDGFVRGVFSAGDPQLAPVALSASRSRLSVSQVGVLCGLTHGRRGCAAVTGVLVAGMLLGLAPVGRAGVLAGGPREAAVSEPPPSLRMVVDHAVRGDLALVHDGRVLTDRKPGVGDGDARVIEEMVRRNGRADAEQSALVAQALAHADPALSKERRAALAALAQEGSELGTCWENAKATFREIQEALYAAREGGRNFAMIGFSGMREVLGSRAAPPDDALVAKAIQELTQVIQATEVTAEVKAEALAMRAKLRFLRSSFDVRGQGARVSMGASELFGLDDLWAAARLLKNVDAEAAFRVQSLIGEAIAADFLVTPTELWTAHNAFQAHGGFGRHVLLSQILDLIRVPSDAPDLLSYARDLLGKVSRIVATGANDLDAASRDMKALLAELRATEDGDGQKALIAAHLRFSLLASLARHETLRGIADGLERSGALPGGRDAEALDAGLFLIERADAHWLAAYSYVPDFLLSMPQLESRPDLVLAIAEKYTSGYDRESFLATWHASSFVRFLPLVARNDPAAAQRLAERFVAQAKQKMALEPEAKEVYSGVRGRIFGEIGEGATRILDRFAAELERG